MTMTDEEKKAFGEKMKAARAAKKAKQAEVTPEGTEKAPAEEPQVSEPAQEAPTPTPEPVPAHVDEANDPTKVALISADGRSLEVSVNGVNWSGKIIYVPKEMESEIRRLLEDGNFYLKN